MELERITLREVFLHSSLCDKIQIFDGFTLDIRPWAPVQLEHLQPIILKVLKEIKKVKGNKEDDKETKWIDWILAIFDRPEFLPDLFHLVYITLEHSNAEIEHDGKRYTLFTEDEMRQYLPLGAIVKILRVVLEQNFEKNLSTESKPQIQGN